MMLARVVETIYWMARYLERAEDMARLINVNAHLMLDMPRNTPLGWEPLIDITGSREAYTQRHDSFEERNVARYLIADKNSPASLLYTLHQAKENARTIRDVIPREGWEAINRLHLFASENINQGVSRRGRFDYLSTIIDRIHTINGLLAGTMNQDEAYLFLRLGRNIERADMTTRFVDVRTANLLPEEDLELSPFESVQWMSVLKTLTGYQMYRRQMQVRIRRSDVMNFLFKSRVFPRAVVHCVSEAQACVRELPNHEASLRAVLSLQRMMDSTDVGRLNPVYVHEFIDQLQLKLANIHSILSRTYFLSGMIEAEREAATQKQSQSQSAPTA